MVKSLKAKLLLQLYEHPKVQGFIELTLQQKYGVLPKQTCREIKLSMTMERAQKIAYTKQMIANECQQKRTEWSWKLAQKLVRVKNKLRANMFLKVLEARFTPAFSGKVGAGYPQDFWPGRCAEKYLLVCQMVSEWSSCCDIHQKFDFVNFSIFC